MVLISEGGHLGIKASLQPRSFCALHKIFITLSINQCGLEIIFVPLYS